MPKIEKILCPTDFSEPSEQALRMAVDLAKTLSAEVHLLHVYQLLIYASEAGSALAPIEVTSAVPQQLQARLDKLRDAHLVSGVPLHTNLLEGVPYTTIVDEAKSLGADLIVMGTHGRTGIRHLLIGSVAERVVRLAQCPVLTVPMPKEG